MWVFGFFVCVFFFALYCVTRPFNDVVVPLPADALAPVSSVIVTSCSDSDSCSASCSSVSMKVVVNVGVGGALVLVLVTSVVEISDSCSTVPMKVVADGVELLVVGCRVLDGALAVVDVGVAPANAAPFVALEAHRASLVLAAPALLHALASHGGGDGLVSVVGQLCPRAGRRVDEAGLAGWRCCCCCCWFADIWRLCCAAVLSGFHMQLGGLTVVDVSGQLVLMLLAVLLVEAGVALLLLQLVPGGGGGGLVNVVVVQLFPRAG